MRIAVVPHSYLPVVGGAEFVVHNAVLEHQRAGHEVAVFPSLVSLSVARHLSYPCVPLWRRAWSCAMQDGDDGTGTALIRRSLRLRLRIAQRWFRADVWHVHSAYPVGWAVIDVLRQELHVPVVITSHGGDLYNITGAVQGQGEGYDPQIRQRIRSTLQSADGLIAVGPKVAETYRGVGVAEDEIAMIPHGWHRGQVQRAIAQRTETRSALGVTHGIIALTVAADRPEKRLDDVLQAADALRADDLVSFVIVTSSARIHDEVARRGLSGRVHVRIEPPLSRADLRYGLPRQEVLDLYAAADVVVLPSVVEASPTVVHEAFNAGCPVITTSAAAAGLVNHGVDGVVVAPEQPGELAEAIRTLERDRAMLARLRTGAGQRGDGLDDWATIAARHREVYTSAIRRHAASPAVHPARSAKHID